MPRLSSSPLWRLSGSPPVSFPSTLDNHTSRRRKEHRRRASAPLLSSSPFTIQPTHSLLLSLSHTQPTPRTHHRPTRHSTPQLLFFSSSPVAPCASLPRRERERRKHMCFVCCCC
jgi:hypothetical protein